MKTMVTAAAAAFLMFGATQAQACDRGPQICSFKLHNNTSIVLQSFWASPSRVNRWEEDILGNRVLNAGHEVNVNLSDGRPDCIYDFRFRFADGDIVMRRNINVCRLGRYTLNE